MPVTRLKFREFVDLLLARLYEREQRREEGDEGGSFFELNEIAQEFKTSIPEDWVFDAGKVLESRGLAEVHYFMGGGCIGRLTGEGRMYVEEERGTGLISNYRRDPSQFVMVVGDNNQLAVTRDAGAISQTADVPEERRPAFKLLRQMAEIVQADPGLSQKERQELKGDIDAIESQLRKREPNRAAIAALLEPMSQIVSIAGAVASLVKLLGG
jgi:hypothetical protein